MEARPGLRKQAIQGWVDDPFGRFELRYFSDGVATALVRTDQVESRDDPADLGPMPAILIAEPVAEPEPELFARVYARRSHRVLSVLLLTIAALTPVVGWEVLVASNQARVVGAIAFAVVAVTVAIIVGTSRTPRLPRNRSTAFAEHQ